MFCPSRPKRKGGNEVNLAGGATMEMVLSANL